MWSILLSTKRAFLLLAPANILWGSTHVVAKAAMEHYDPWLVASIRMSLATLFLWLFQLRKGLKAVEATNVCWSDAGGMLALGMFGVALEMLLWHYGLHLSSSTSSSLLVVGEMLFTAFAATVLFRERLGWDRAAAALLAALGVVILVGGGGLLSSHGIGDLLILLSTFVEGLYTVLGARFARRYPAHVVLTWTNTGGMLIWLPMCLQRVSPEALQIESWEAVAGVLYLAVVSSGICYLIWFHVLGRIGANAGAPMLVLQPLTGVLLSVTLLGEPLWASRAIGGLVILAAMALNAFAIYESPSLPGPASADVPESSNAEIVPTRVSPGVAQV